MAKRTFDVVYVCEILVHWPAGRSRKELAGSLGLSRNTVRKGVAVAEAAGIVPGGPAVSGSGGQSWRGSGSRSWYRTPAEALTDFQTAATAA